MMSGETLAWARHAVLARAWAYGAISSLQPALNQKSLIISEAILAIIFRRQEMLQSSCASAASAVKWLVWRSQLLLLVRSYVKCVGMAFRFAVN
jgi:hypothetical protein